MKSSLLILHLLLFSTSLFAQESKKGEVIVDKFLAESIQGNRGGEEPMRKLTIYLPPDYKNGKKHYPVIYYLHGFLVNDSLMMQWQGLKELMDSAISSGKIKPVILVLPNSDTHFGGSFYTNSSLTGNWSDYIVKDVVNYIDKKYRTVQDKNSRGLTGHSMGGNGAIKIAMLYPNVFGAIYALSPAVLGWAGDFTINNPAFKNIDSFKNALSGMEIVNGLMQNKPDAQLNFDIQLMADLARTYSPDNSSNFLSASMPASYVSEKMTINAEVKRKWEINFPLNMVDGHLQALKKLNALKIDWGRNDAPLITISCLEFSKKLETAGISHFAEEYLGGHVDKQSGFDGRLYTEMLPFFNIYLKFNVNKD